VWDFCLAKVPHLRSDCMTFALRLHYIYAQKVALLAHNNSSEGVRAAVFSRKTVRKGPSDFQNDRKLLQDF